MILGTESQIQSPFSVYNNLSFKTRFVIQFLVLVCWFHNMGKDQKACAACRYQRRKCLSGCPFAPIFPRDREEDFQNVSGVFGANKFIKLLKYAKSSERHLAAEAMIIEANARTSDPVHGLAGFAATLSERLDYLTSELEMVNQQNQFHRQRNKFCKNSFGEF
ncbi:hypothetical protein MKX01_003996 [Papaver californicum]|nr:hypothetical protein MKX01_003996 [Papaver californicum]